MTLRAEKAEVDKEFKELDRQIKEIWDEERTNDLGLFQAAPELLLQRKAVCAKYNDKFILAGWIPPDEKKFRLALDAVDSIEYTIESPRHPPFAPVA